MYANVMKMQQTHGFKHFDFVAKSFILPLEYQEFLAYYQREHRKNGSTWIIKPVASSRGRGIYLANNINHIPLDENIIVGRYLDNPLLIDGFKFDVRLYVAVTSYDPLIIYLYEEGLTRFCTIKYDTKNPTASRNLRMHLTNYSLNKKSMDYVRCDNPDVEDYGNKWSMSAMLRYLRESGIDTSELCSRIEDVIIKSIISVELPVATATKMFVPNPRGNCVELYGFDILVDDQLKPWVLEVNLSPSLATDAPLDLKIKANCMADWMNLAGLSLIDPVSKNKSLREEASGSIRGTSRISARPQSSRASVTPSQDRDLSSEESKILKWARDQDARKGGFARIFPRPDTWEKYGKFLQHRTTYNSLLARRLFRDFQVPTPVGIDNRTSGIPVVSKFARNRAMAERVLMYERKLLSLMELKDFNIKKSKEEKSKEKSKTKADSKKQLAIKSGEKKLLNKRPVVRAQTAKFDSYRPKNVDAKSELVHKSTENNHTTVILKEKEASKTEKQKYGFARYSENPEVHNLEVQKENISQNYQNSSQNPNSNSIQNPGQVLGQISRQNSSTNSIQNPAQPSTFQKPTQRPPTHPSNNNNQQPTNTQMQKILERVQSRSQNRPISASAASDPSNTAAQANLRIRAKKIYHQLKSGPSGPDFLSAREARRAFHSYLCRVQIRLTHEASLDPSSMSISEQKQEQQLALVTRFLVRAAENLPTPLPITVPSKDQFNLITRKKLIASQLSIFVQKYQVETDRQQTDDLLSSSSPKSAGNFEKDFDIFVRNASENELEDVLTLYTKRNKSAAIFLGTKPRPKVFSPNETGDNKTDYRNNKTDHKINNHKEVENSNEIHSERVKSATVNRVRHRPPSAPTKTVPSNDEKRVIEALQRLGMVTENNNVQKLETGSRSGTPTRPWK
jgi:tubulin polyglutamylase TTLL5